MIKELAVPFFTHYKDVNQGLIFLVIDDKSSGNCLSLIFVWHVLGSEFGRVYSKIRCI